jgi:putative Mg2+ transporter-C (MgtC) family protein
MDDPVSNFFGMQTWAWEWQAIVRLIVAGALGALIGIERDHRGRAAGFRTLLLVSLGAALAMVVSINFGNVYTKPPFASDAIRIDPARVAYGVMVGIGFLGAGVIVRHGTGVRGLTTAAALWCTAAIGLACGFGMITIALASTGLVLITLLGLFHLELLVPSRTVRYLSVTLPISGEDTARKFADWVKARGVPVLGLQCERDLKAGTETLTFEISLPGRVSPSSLLDMVEEAPGASRISIE